MPTWKKFSCYVQNSLLLIMTCGGFTCSKNALAALNVLYILVAFILIGVATYGRAVAIITSISIMSGIIVCGVFLLLVAIIGLVGAIKHHQVLLFFYMIILFLLFLVQIAIACTCLAVKEDQQEVLAETGWNHADATMRMQVQKFFGCCGFKEPGNDSHCEELKCCQEYLEANPNVSSCCNPSHSGNGTSTECTACPACWGIMQVHMNQAVKIAGGIGLFFSFTEIIGVWLALRYRNQKDPRANPSAFL